jgi:hypothetical protein
LDKYSICKQSHHFSHFSSHHTWRSIQQHYLSLIYNIKINNKEKLLGFASISLHCMSLWMLSSNTLIMINLIARTI